MCKAGKFDFSHASLTSQAALGRLRRLPEDDPVLHAELMLPSVPLPAGDAVEEEPFLDVDVYDDCDIPLGVLSDMLHGVSAPGKFSIDAEGGIACSGDAEKSDAEDDSESEAVEVAQASCHSWAWAAQENGEQALPQRALGGALDSKIDIS